MQLDRCMPLNKLKLKYNLMKISQKINVASKAASFQFFVDFLEY